MQQAMTAQALYRRWRSQTFDEILAQEHVTRTLQNALRAGRVAHAYLFAGPRGTGKTSTARILAKAVNCLAELEKRPCNRCARCQATSAGRDLDLIEIDAASNRGIDEIRELREKIAFAPNEGRYKVYVVDEVHMLTTEAFNALLKTLEEPPPHVIFVLATTEPQKIPATILSRCQRFDFRRIPLDDLCRKIERICQAEGIAIQPAAVQAIARRASGSFRDAESLLDQLAAYGDAEITLERVRDLLGGVSLAAVGDLVQAWLDGDLSGGLRQINRLVDEGADARTLHAEVVEYLRSLLLLQAGGDEKLANVSPEMAERMRGQLARLTLGRLVEGLRLFSGGEPLPRGEVRPQMPLEMAFVQAVLQGSAREAPEASRPAPAGQVRPRPAAPPARPPAVAEARSARPAPASSAEGGPPAGKGGGQGPTLAWLRERWPQVLQAVGAQDKKLQAFLRDGRPAEVQGGRVVLEMRYGLHRDQVMADRNRRLVEGILQELSGAACRVECTVAGKAAPRGSRNDALDDPAVREDRVVRYAMRDLGAQVRQIEEIVGPAGPGEGEPPGEPPAATNQGVHPQAGPATTRGGEGELREGEPPGEPPAATNQGVHPQAGPAPTRQAEGEPGP